MIDKIKQWKWVDRTIRASRRIVLPGFDGIPLYDVTKFFLQGIFKGYISTRASAIAFSFFLAIFPMIIVFFSLIPFIPVTDFHVTLMDLMREVTPQNTFETIESTLEDIITRPRGGLLSITFILAVVFATNGFDSIIEAFNGSVHAIETRSWIRQRLVAILMLFIVSIIIILSITMITVGTFALNVMLEQGILKGWISYYLLQFGRWIIILAMFFFTVSFIYYLAPAKRRSFRFISAGSSLATFLSLAASIGFNYYVKNFASYNALYGSIGTLLIIMVWMHFNALILLIGFELNASIYHAKQEKTTLLPENT